jgi:hypothetical protein
LVEFTSGLKESVGIYFSLNYFQTPDNLLEIYRELEFLSKISMNQKFGFFQLNKLFPFWRRILIRFRKDKQFDII